MQLSSLRRLYLLAQELLDSRGDPIGRPQGRGLYGLEALGQVARPHHAAGRARDVERADLVEILHAPKTPPQLALAAGVGDLDADEERAAFGHGGTRGRQGGLWALARPRQLALAEAGARAGWPRRSLRRRVRAQWGRARRSRNHQLQERQRELAPPFREVEFDITYGEGVSREGSVIDLGVDTKVVEKSGAWLSYKGERIGQGRENAKKFLKENPDIYAKIEAEILVKSGIVVNTTNLAGVPDASAVEAKAVAKAAEPARAAEAAAAKAAAGSPVKVVPAQPEDAKGRPAAKAAGK